MMSAIILLLAVLTAGSIVGIIILALLELNAIDDWMETGVNGAEVREAG